MMARFVVGMFGVQGPSTDLPHIRGNFRILLRVLVNIRHTVEHDKQFLAFVSLPDNGIACLKSTKHTPLQEVLSLRASSLSVNGYMCGGANTCPKNGPPIVLFARDT